MTSMEYREMKIPEEILARLEKSAEEHTQDPSKPLLTLGEAGVFEWLSALSKSDGWRVVWQGFNFPYVILERETTS